MHDAGSGEHVLWACALPNSALQAAKPFICRYHPLVTSEVYAGLVPVRVVPMYTRRIDNDAQMLLTEPAA